MRLVVKQADRTVNECRFTKGPVYIGRHTRSQIFLADGTVSRQHAVVYRTQDGQWMVEDLDSLNKTYLNNEPIHKAEIKDGDVLRIADFTIEVHLEDATAEKAINLEDTLTKTSYGLEDTSQPGLTELQVITRRLDAKHAPEIKLPATRIKDFVQATEKICNADGIDEVLGALLDIAAKQFSSFHTWVALRSQPSGPMTCHAGRKKSGETIQLSELKFNDKITEAVEKGRFLLIPRIPITAQAEQIHSAMITPIVGQAGVFGVLYVDNDMAHERYNLSDLDYAALLAVHTAAILKNF